MRNNLPVCSGSRQIEKFSSSARNWIAEYAAGLPNYKRFRQADLDHPVEQVGKKLRARMPWLQANTAKSPTTAETVTPLKKAG